MTDSSSAATLGPLRVGAPRTRAETLAARLEQQITTAGLQPGDYIGNLDELRADTGFARSTVSEAVRLLRERGMLEIRPGRGGGLFVAQPNPVIRLRHTLLTVRDEPSSVMDAIAVREALEELISRDAARYRDDADIGDLKKLLTRLQHATKSHDSFMRANWKLHERIASISPNTMASAVYKGTLGYISSSSAQFDQDDSERSAYFTQRYQVHEELIQAIVGGDDNAVVAAVKKHNTAD
jgi:DNA-binding FadR family transcriptional regulator